jgi:glycosyltransferase involved in cell wall biosynthesis
MQTRFDLIGFSEDRLASMRIAFYAPMKSPNHPVPSGDRQMARLLIKALERSGHEVTVASELRSFATQRRHDHYPAVSAEAEREIFRLSALWEGTGRPDLWFSYHPYYKAPDFLGPPLASRFGIPYVTAEASYSERRNVGAWVETQALVVKAVTSALFNICFTRRDLEGLEQIAPGARFAMLPPFIDISPFESLPPPVDSRRLVAVGMMRPGDKLDSYRMLARSLEQVVDLPWTLSIAGDGPSRREVEAEFAGLPAERVEWHGIKQPDEIPLLLANAAIYVWPGCGEAYGLSYLEAQATGLPVVAQDTAGVPEVVRNGETGILTPSGDIEAFSSAIARLLSDPDERRTMGEAARRFVNRERSLDAAATRLEALCNVLAS